mgnify:CR=1 FL=1
MSQMKKFIIVCNEGSLGGSGKIQKNIRLVEWAISQEDAIDQFNNCRTNRIYGRTVKSVEEARS